MLGDLLIRWTIRLSLLLYAFAMALRLRAREDALPPLARWLWGLGALLLLAHTLVAFHVAHHWDHAHAVAATAKGTYDVIGIDWGGGLYVNYLFTLTWLADAVWWNVWPRSHAQHSGWLTALLHFFLAFIIVNATMIFHDGFIRWSGIVACLLLGIMYWRTRRIERAKAV